MYVGITSPGFETTLAEHTLLKFRNLSRRKASTQCSMMLGRAAVRPMPSFSKNHEN
jgi:hypothetical protein